MDATEQTSWIAYSKGKCIASGAPRAVVTEVKRFVGSHAKDNVTILDARTSETVEVDFRGSVSTVLKRIPSAPIQNPERNIETLAPERTVGRPRLGVTAREVTLLPRHWEWLSNQPGGASVALRKLVEQALRSSKESDRLRQAQEAAYRFMNVMAGDSPGFEEATRALFASDIERLQQFVSTWPRDVRKQALLLAGKAIAKDGGLEHAPQPIISSDLSRQAAPGR
ncbi:MAG: DUF2239 family protein [Gammaproteobacteria bacterium]|nr:MAG: DUF2239 family protein [Gammaproteobacteria bacterium]